MVRELVLTRHAQPLVEDPRGVARSWAREGLERRLEAYPGGPVPEGWRLVRAFRGSVGS